MPSYILFGLMVVTVVLPVVPILGMLMASDDDDRPYLVLAMLVLYILSMGVLVATWAASIELHPRWWDGGGLGIVAWIGVTIHAVLVSGVLSLVFHQDENVEDEALAEEAPQRATDEQVDRAADSALHGMTEKPT